MSAGGEGRPLTYGEKAVGLDFNPSGNVEVHQAKKLFADAIDMMHLLRAAHPDSEIARMATIAIAEAITAQMWAVKALTWKH